MSNDSLRITVQLIDALTGQHIWAENYDRKLKDIFALQDEIAMKIMAELQVNIAYESLGRSSPIQTKNLKAYEKFLKGVERYFRRTEEDILYVRKIFKEAIALDPEYGAAYVMLGHTHLDDIWYHRTNDRAKSLQTAEQYEEAIPLWNKTIELNRDYLFAYIGLTGAYQMSGDEIKAHESATEVLRIKPTYSMAMVKNLTIKITNLKSAYMKHIAKLEFQSSNRITRSY